ncbi:MAG: two pore domain potassium channel family protein [Euryhalocaulis sp.]|uniref:ion channel n=1 Tax=Euryhalocaulis sp. TaxID=2744307 RepID=UPI00183C65AE|nr:ion channel [Euryhalocaulis sp.]MBA4801070.1 two pore domain potassium channel family protein [Euryhalocaulis sp.]
MLTHNSVWFEKRAMLWITVLMTGIIVLHVLESTLYAAGYWIGLTYLDIGGFERMADINFMNVLYYSIVTYSSLGLGDAYPTGHLKFMTGIQALNGFLAISCSASVMFVWMRDYLPQIRR